MAYALMVAIDPRFRPDQIGPYVLIVLILALGFGWRLFRRPSKALWLVALAAMILIPAVAVARGFGRVDMIAMMFHADFGMAGATVEGLETEILQASLSALFLALSFALLAGLWALGARSYVIFAALVVALNPGFRSVAWATVMPAVESDLMSRYTDPTLKAQPPTTPDLVIIYLEGTDRHFADEAEPPRVCRRVFCSMTMRPYRVSSGLHRTPPLLLRAGCSRWVRGDGGCYTNRPI
jgi:hypothetical protein